MRFWDTSALVPLCVSEPASREIRRLATADPSLVVWWGTRTECLSAFARGRREAKLAAAVEQRTRRVLATLAAAWSEILPTDPVRDRAERLLGVHPLRAAGAFQLAAALVWSRGETSSHAVVSYDDRLRAAASGEGFAVLPD